MRVFHIPSQCWNIPISVTALPVATRYKDFAGIIVMIIVRYYWVKCLHVAYSTYKYIAEYKIIAKNYFTPMF